MLDSRRLGAAWTLDRVWERLGVDAEISRVAAARRLAGEVVERVVFALVAQRACEPGSKLAATGWVAERVAIEGCPGFSSAPRPPRPTKGAASPRPARTTPVLRLHPPRQPLKPAREPTRVVTRPQRAYSTCLLRETGVAGRRHGTKRAPWRRRSARRWPGRTRGDRPAYGWRRGCRR